jgi:hypothetical protein
MFMDVSSFANSLRAWYPWRDDKEFAPVAHELRTMKICAGYENS